MKDEIDIIENKQYKVPDIKRASWIIALLLCSFLGLLGVHRFYTGYKKIGFIQLLLTISLIGTIFSFIWVIIDIISLITEKYTNSSGELLYPENLSITVKIIIKIAAIIYFLFIFVIATSSNETPEVEHKTQPTVNINTVSKLNFNEKWPFTVDTVELHHIDIDGELDGVEVVIDDKSYALTRNIEDHDFLPDKYWKNAEFETAGKYQVCSDTLIADKCKVSLSNIIQHAEKLPLIKAY